MEIRQLRSFVVLAEELNFTRAAERCNLGQPALSKLIAALERELGVLLFERDKRRVALTPEGQAFLASARTSLGELERGVRKVRQPPAPPELRVAFSEYLYGTALPSVLQLFREAYPDVRVQPIEVYTAQGREAVLCGRADVTLMVLPADTGGLHQEPFSRETLCVYLPRDHPLASRPQLAFADLEGEALLVCDRSLNPGFFDHVARAHERAGVQPTFKLMGRTSPVPSPRGVWELVAAGQGLHLNLEALARVYTLPPSVVARPLTSSGPHADLAVAWREPSFVVNAFLRVLREWRAAQNLPGKVAAFRAEPGTPPIAV